MSPLHRFTLTVENLHSARMSVSTHKWRMNNLIYATLRHLLRHELTSLLGVSIMAVFYSPVLSETPR